MYGIHKGIVWAKCSFLKANVGLGVSYNHCYVIEWSENLCAMLLCILSVTYKVFAVNQLTRCFIKTLMTLLYMCGCLILCDLETSREVA